MRLFALLFVILFFNVIGALDDCDPSELAECQHKVDIMREFIATCSDDPANLDWDNLECSIFDPPPCCPNDPHYVCDDGEKKPRTHWDNVRATSDDRARDYDDLLLKEAPPIPSDAIFKIKLRFRVSADSAPVRRLTTSHLTNIEQAIKDYIGVQDAVVDVIVRDPSQDLKEAEISIELPDTAILVDLMDTNVYLYELNAGDLDIPGVDVDFTDREIEEENGGTPTPDLTAPQGMSNNTFAGLKPETSMALFIVFGVVAGIIVGAALMFAIKSRSKAVPAGKAFETNETFNVRNPMAAKAVSAKSAPDHVHVPRRVPRPNTTENAQRVAFATMQRSNTRRPSRQVPRV